jgi:hypothetical protein
MYAPHAVRVPREASLGRFGSLATSWYCVCVCVCVCVCMCGPCEMLYVSVPASLAQASFVEMTKERNWYVQAWIVEWPGYYVRFHKYPKGAWIQARNWAEKGYWVSVGRVSAHCIEHELGGFHLPSPWPVHAFH